MSRYILGLLALVLGSNVSGKEKMHRIFSDRTVYSCQVWRRLCPQLGSSNRNAMCGIVVSTYYYKGSQFCILRALLSCQPQNTSFLPSLVPLNLVIFNCTCTHWQFFENFQL
uniref:Putative secreted protein n=1 Tax=Rhipicephalus microplus TaxID=6941 RepID=A0A6G5A3R0_RHIMP